MVSTGACPSVWQPYLFVFVLLVWQTWSRHHAIVIDSDVVLPKLTEKEDFARFLSNLPGNCRKQVDISVLIGR